MKLLNAQQKSRENSFWRFIRNLRRSSASIKHGTEHHSTRYARYLCVGHCRSQHSAYNVWSEIQRIRSEYRAHHVQNVRIHRQCAYRKNTNVHSIQQLDRQRLGFITNSPLDGSAISRLSRSFLLLNFVPNRSVIILKCKRYKKRLHRYSTTSWIRPLASQKWRPFSGEKSKIAASNVFGQKSAPKSTWNALHVNVLAKKYNNLLDLYSVFPFQ